MSLVSFLNDNADVRERFQQEFKKPEFLAAVGFIRKCISVGLEEVSKVDNLEKRLAHVESLLRTPAKKKT